MSTEDESQPGARYSHWVIPENLEAFIDAMQGVSFWLTQHDAEATTWPTSPIRYQLLELEGRIKAAENARGRIRVLEQIVEANDAANTELGAERAKLSAALRELAARALMVYELVIREQS